MPGADHFTTKPVFVAEVRHDFIVGIGSEVPTDKLVFGYSKA